MNSEERERVRDELSKLSIEELTELAKKRFSPGLPEIHIGVDPGVPGGDQTIVVAVEGDDGVMHVEGARTWRERRERMERERRATRVYYSHAMDDWKLLYMNMWSDLWRDPNIIEGTAVEVETRPERLLDAGGSEP